MNKVTSTAPERIWLQVSDDADDCDLPFTYTYSDEVTWCEDSVTACQVEYVRADITEAENAALRKAVKFYAKHEHWMSLGEDGPRKLLVANGDTDSVEGWAMADAALLAGKEKQP